MSLSAPRSHDRWQAERKAKEWKNLDRRDHLVVLGLPVNLREVNRKSQCKHLKNASRKMALKWHPDKAKGDKKRAARKLNEIMEAKEHLKKEFGCKRIR